MARPGEQPVKGQVYQGAATTTPTPALSPLPHLAPEEWELHNVALEIIYASQVSKIKSQILSRGFHSVGDTEQGLVACKINSNLNPDVIEKVAREAVESLQMHSETPLPVNVHRDQENNNLLLVTTAAIAGTLLRNLRNAKSTSVGGLTGLQ